MKVENAIRGRPFVQQIPVKHGVGGGGGERGRILSVFACGFLYQGKAQWSHIYLIRRFVLK